MECKYCKCDEAILSDKNIIYCYNCGKYEYLGWMKVYVLLKTIYFYFLIFFCPWSKSFREWWKYIFAPRTDKDVNIFKVWLCRWRGHPCGVVWYNAGGLEPDMSCRYCGDNIG